ncbi:MAG TPA: hypothetical protein DCE41_31815 [Cytophagales bacterium]|nr:hypothetical protein [Cytophagales bacterium]HAA20229.1 hypothetical protein [Cytophagales bacterium]
MVHTNTTVIDAPTEEEVLFPLITMTEGDPDPGEEEIPRNTDPPPAGQTEPSTPPDPGGGDPDDDDDGDIKPGSSSIGDSTQ